MSKLGLGGCHRTAVIINPRAARPQNLCSRGENKAFFTWDFSDFQLEILDR